MLYSANAITGFPKSQSFDFGIMWHSKVYVHLFISHKLQLHTVKLCCLTGVRLYSTENLGPENGAQNVWFLISQRIKAEQKNVDKVSIYRIANIYGLAIKMLNRLNKKKKNSSLNSLHRFDPTHQ